MTLPYRPQLPRHLPRNLRKQSARRRERSLDDGIGGPDFASWISHLPAILAGLFAITYGVLRPANEYFYERLGLTPEDLGVTEPTLIARAASYAAVLTVAGVSFGAFFLLGRRLNGYLFRVSSEALLKALENWKRSPKGKAMGRWWQGLSRGWQVGVGAVIYVAFAAMSLWGLMVVLQLLRQLGQTDTTGSSNAASAVLMGGLFFVFGWAWSTMVLAIGMLGQKDTPRFRTRTAVLVAVAATFTISSVTVLDFWDNAGRYGSHLLQGSRTTTDAETSKWLAVHISPARLISLKPKDDFLVCDGKKVPLLLGASGGFSIIISYPDERMHGGQVLRLPESDYAVVGGLPQPEPCSPK